MRSHKRMLSVTETESSERNPDAVTPAADGDGHVVSPVGGDTDIIDFTQPGDQNNATMSEDATEGLCNPADAPRIAHDFGQVMRRMSNISIDSQNMLDQFPEPPIVHISPGSPQVSIRREILSGK